MIGLQIQSRLTMGKLLCLLLILCQALSAHAEEFAASSVARQELQSRDFNHIDARSLLLAGLAVVQDIKFQVTESQLKPGLLVAQSGQHGLSSPVLTISVRQVPGKTAAYRVSLSAAIHTAGTTNLMDSSDFYQDFFTQLQRELFKQRTSL